MARESREKKTFDRIINFFLRNSFLKFAGMHDISDDGIENIWAGVVRPDFGTEETSNVPLEEMHTLHDIEELNLCFSRFVSSFDHFCRRFCDVLVAEDSCLTEQEKGIVKHFFSDYFLQDDIGKCAALLQSIYLDVKAMEKHVRIANFDSKDSAYVLAVKQGLLKEEQDGTYTPIFEAGKKGLINVLHRWHDLLEENEIPMPTYEDIANKVRKENGEAYNKNSIRNYLSRVGSLE